MPDVFEMIGTADGISGNSVKLFLDGVPVLALQNFNWKIKVRPESQVIVC